MRCVTPMFRFFNKEHHESGRVISREEARQYMKRDPNAIRHLIKRFNCNDQESIGFEQIPCGYCWACRLNYSAEWASRLTLECEKSDHNYFITLTYDDENLPILEWIKDKSGEKYENDGTWTTGSLVPEDMTRFIKTLRKYYERRGHTKIKYFYCGEYGDIEKTCRPHYHMILLNCPLDIEEFYDTEIDENFKAHWKSRQLEQWWPHGLVDVAEVEWSSAAYVARYCMKKLGTRQDDYIYFEHGKLPEFIRMSKGIGTDYLSSHMQEIYENDELIMKTFKGNVGIYKPPKAFDRKFKELFPEEFELIQESRRKAADRARKIKQELTDYTDQKMLEMEREKVLTKAKMLPRAAIE